MSNDVHTVLTVLYIYTYIKYTYHIGRMHIGLYIFKYI